MGSNDRRSCALAIALAVVIAWGLTTTADAAGKKGLCATAAESPTAPPYLGVVAAFPAELALLVAATDVERTVEIDGRLHVVGRLDGVSVVLGLTGIGLHYAERRTNALLESFEIGALLMSGVAASRHRVGDVVLPSEWTERDGPVLFEANRALLALGKRARKRVAPGSLDTCTHVPPPNLGAPVVCLPYDPAILLEGHGYSDDDFGVEPLPCVPRGGPIFGCEVSQARPAPPPSGETAIVAAPTTPEDLVDMETAAVARVAAERGVPFLGVRAVSDGGSFAEFFDYYQLAANNAALVTRAVVAEIARLARKRSARPICRLLAKERWRRAAAGISAPKPATPTGSGY